jgi:SAM-dependent methyltransferase
MKIFQSNAQKNRGVALKRRSFLNRIAMLAALTPFSVSFAQTNSQTPPVAIEEVPYVQTPMHVVRRMLELAEVGRSDLVWDLGSGDGRIVIAAAKRGARAVGYEIDPRLIRESEASARRARVAGRAKFVERDLFTLNFREPSVVTMYLLPEFNLKLRPLLLAQMKPGSRIVSHEWDMGDWKPDETLIYPSAAKPHGTSNEHKVFVWIVPADASGRWRVAPESGTLFGADAIELQITQNFQKLAVHASIGRVLWTQLRGTELTVAIENGSQRLSIRGKLRTDSGAESPTYQWTGEIEPLGSHPSLAVRQRQRFNATRVAR